MSALMVDGNRESALMVTPTPTPDTAVNWLTATVMSELMVSGNGDDCVNECGAGNECVDG